MNISLQYPQNVKNHSLHMHVKLNANLTFLTSSFVKVLKISRGNKLVFWKLLLLTIWMIPAEDLTAIAKTYSSGGMSLMDPGLFE